MYLADAFNARNLFQHVGGWVSALDPSAQHRAHVLLQRAHQVLVHLEQVYALRSLALGQFARRFLSLDGEPHRVHAWSPIVANLVVELSAAFGALRLLQNESWGLATAAYGIRCAPSSLRDACGKLGHPHPRGQKRPSWMSSVPQQVRGLFVQYWAQSGRRLAEYRDVDQHFDVLARQCFLDRDANGFRRLWICLPDNPEAKAPNKFTYATDTDGIALAETEFQRLHALVESVAVEAGATETPLHRAVDFHPPITHEAGVRRATAVVTYDIEGRSGMIFGQTGDMHVFITTLPDL